MWGVGCRMSSAHAVEDEEGLVLVAELADTRKVVRRIESHPAGALQAIEPRAVWGGECMVNGREDTNGGKIWSASSRSRYSCPT